MAFNISSLTKPVARLAATAQNGLEVLRLGDWKPGAQPRRTKLSKACPCTGCAATSRRVRGRRMPGPSCSWCIR